MFFQIFLFEIKYRIKRPATWIYFFIFFLIGFLSIATGSTPATEKVMHNAPWVVTSGNILFSMVAMLVCSAIMGVPLYRDIEHNTRNYFFAYPITKAAYFWGRFIGSFVFVLLVFSGFNWGCMAGAGIGPALGWVPAERIGDYGIWNYFYPYFTYSFTNLLLSSTIFFALVSLTRNIKVIYSASILLFIAYLLASFLVRDVEQRELVKLLDPFASNTFDLETRFWTPFEKNTLAPPFTQVVVLNRAIWLGVALLIIGFAYYRFSFQKFLQPEQVSRSKKKNEDKEEAPEMKWDVEKNFTQGYGRKIWWSLTRLEFFNIVKDNYFKVILGGGVIFLFIDFWIGNTQFGVGNKPLTMVLMDYKNYNYSVFIFIILLFYTGEAVHREKTTRFNIINDALPVSNTVLYLSKLFAIICVAFLLVHIPIVVGVLVQVLKGFYDFNFPVYFTEMYLLTFPSYVLMVLLGFAVHTVVNNKFGGHGIAMLIWVTMFLLRSYAEMDYNLLFYFYTPNYMWSDMNGIGHFMKPQTMFNLYWFMLGAFLVTLAYLFFQRGIVGGFKERWRVAMQRAKGWPLVLSTFFLVGWLALGAFIYYNVSMVNKYYTAKETRNRQARYEKTLKQYQYLAQPKVTAVYMNANIFPEERRVDIRTKLVVYNKSNEVIPALHMDAETNIDYSLLYNGQPLAYTNPLSYPHSVFSFMKQAHDTFNYRIYKLPIPMQPGDSAVINVHSKIENKGFVNSGLTREILYNGTFYSGGLPSFGYNDRREIESPENRKKNGLPPQEDDLPNHDDPRGINRLMFTKDADMVHFEATVSTAADQVAIAPGYLQKTWEQNGRKYFSYVQDSPINYFFTIVSARYKVLKDVVTLNTGEKVDIEVFYHEQHPFNLDRFVASYKDALTYFSETYGPFQFRQMRLLEFPRYAGFAQSFPNTVPFSESFAWVADFKSPNDFDYAYYITAHEVAHQWWGHQVVPNYTRGANLLSESLAEYTALILAERKYGKDNMRRFLKDELDGYLSGRANEAKKENTFINCNRAYQWYQKGSLVLYGLRDLIGDKTLNTALREFRDSFALRQKPPFAGSHDLYTVLKKYTPDSLQYFLTDTWERITLYENKLVKASAKPAGNNWYDVTLEYNTRKMYADSTGKESVAPMNDYIDLAVFGEETKDKNGRRLVNTLVSQKYKLTPGQGKITLRVKGKPIKAGIDPMNKLIDRIPADNMGDVEVM